MVAPCVEVIVKVCHPAHPPVEAPDLQAHIRLGDVAYTAPFPSGGLTTMAVTQLPPNHKITYTVAVKDAVGNPAFVADPTWQRQRAHRRPQRQPADPRGRASGPGDAPAHAAARRDHQARW